MELHSTSDQTDPIMNQPTFHRRQVLSTVGAVTVGTPWITGSVRANQQYTTALAPVDGITTSATGEAIFNVDTDVPEATYEISVDCLRSGTHISLSPEHGIIAEYPLEGPVTRGVVRDATIAEGTISRDDLDKYGYEPEAVFDAFETDNVSVAIHTEQHPDGEIMGTLTHEDEEPPINDESSLDEDPSAVVVTVGDAETGEPIEGAEVLIVSADGDPADAVDFSFRTDVDGRVEEYIEIGNFVIEIAAEGYQTDSGEVGLEHEYHAELTPDDDNDSELDA